MKKTIKALSLLTALFSTASIAASGSALIPHFLSHKLSNFYSYFYVSNITSEPVDVTITFYDQDGNIITDQGNSSSTGYFRGYYYSSYAEPPVDSSIKLTIGPQKTTTISLQSYNTKSGYGKIEWSQAGTETRTAIIAHGRSYRNKSGYEGSYTIPINNGIEF